MEMLILMEIVGILNLVVLHVHQGVLYILSIIITITAGMEVLLVFMGVKIAHLFARLVQTQRPVANVLLDMA